MVVEAVECPLPWVSDMDNGRRVLMQMLEMPPVFAKIVQTERHELALMAEVPPIFCKDSEKQAQDKEKIAFFAGCGSREGRHGCPDGLLTDCNHGGTSFA